MKDMRLNIRALFQVMFILVGIAAVSFQAQAQEKIVSGLIKDKVTRKPIDLSSVTVTVFSFNTVAQAQDVADQLKADANTLVTTHSAQAYPDMDGYYEIKVADTGALLFVAGMSSPQLEKVSGRLQINVVLDVGILIPEAVISEERAEIAVINPQSEIIGNTLKVSSGITVPSLTGKSDARLIVQPILLDRMTKDTLRYLTPMVVDGKEYFVTQKSRMNFDLSNDPLSGYVSRKDTLSEEKMLIPWEASIYVKDPSREFLIMGILHMEDYIKPYFSREMMLASVRLRRPLRFLKYDIDAMELDENDYYIPPRKEKMNSAGSVSLHFKLNESELLADDVEGRRQLDSLKRVLLSIVNGEGSILQEFHIKGTSSPEGVYEKNVNLAKERTDYALSEIISILPKRVRDRVWSTSKSEVRPWSDVADMIEAEDSLSVQAVEIRRIIKQNQSSIDRQSRYIKELPYYDEIKEKYLPRLRSVQYSISYEVNRTLTPEEILNKWRSDEDFRNGRRSFTLHEYWQLFRLIKNQDELEEVYRLAYEDTKKTHSEAWEFAAGRYSSTLIRKGIVDTTILSPYIDFKIHNTDVSIRRMNGTGTDIKNRMAIVYNQLGMCLRSQDFARSSQLSQMLPDTEDTEKLKAFAMCLGGYYKGGANHEERERNKRYFDVVCKTSTWNRVVMCLARGNNEKIFNDEALVALEELPDDEPMKYYFKAIALGRRGYDSLMESEANLYKACKMKPSLIDLAAGDGDIREDSFNEVKKALSDQENGDLIYGFY